MNSRKINPACLVWISGLIIVLSAAQHIPYTLLSLPLRLPASCFQPKGLKSPTQPYLTCCLEQNQHMVGAGKAHEFPHKPPAAQPQLWRGHGYKWIVLARPFRTNWYHATSPELGLSPPRPLPSAAQSSSPHQAGWPRMAAAGGGGAAAHKNPTLLAEETETGQLIPKLLRERHAGKLVTHRFLGNQLKHAHTHDWWLISTGICQSSQRK